MGLNQDLVQNIPGFHHVHCATTFLAFNGKTLTFNFKVSILVLIKCALKIWVLPFFQMKA